MRKFWSVLAILFCTASSNVVWALQLREPQSVSVEAGTAFEYRLEEEVTKSVTGVEFVLTEAPGWLKLDGDRLFGTPPNKNLGPNVISFRAREKKLTTPPQDGKIVLNVFVTPTLPPEFSLGELEERKKLEMNLRAKTQHPEIENLAFRVSPRDEMPEWLRLSAEGMLTGTPERAHIGSKFDFRIWVTSNYGGKAETRVSGRVKKIPVATRWKKKDIELVKAKEDAPFRAELVNPEWVENPEGARLRFKFVNAAAAWPELSWDGALRGIPRRKDIGKKTFEVEMEATVDGQTFKDVARVTIDTERINKPPQWKSPMVQLPRGSANQKFEFKDLAREVTDVDQDKLSFEIVPQSGPEWMQMSTDGTLRADVRPQYAGTHRWKIRVTDGQYPIEARMEMSVDNRAPVWKLAGSALPDSVQSQPYTFDLKTIVQDDDKDTLAFEPIRVPEWMKLEAGKLEGTPERDHVGQHRVRLRVTDGQATAQLEATVKVILKAYPPEPNITALKFRMKERAEFKVNLNDPKLVQDPNGDTLRFTWEGGKPPPWAQLTETGQLTLHPQLAQVGIQYLPLQISDGKFNVPAKVEIEVLRDPRPSQWAEAPLAFKSRAREPFSNTVGKQVRDLDSLPVKFYKKRGPSWLEVSPTGELSGTPPDSALGKNQFVIVADNGLVPSEKLVDVEVDFKNHPPEVFQQKLVFEIRERATLDLDLQQSRYTADSDKTDIRTFTMEKPVDFVKMSPQGAVNIAPQFKNIGQHAIGFVVSDGKDKTRGELQIQVLRDPRAPQWEKEELTFEILTRDAFRLDLNKHVKDLDGLKIQFEKSSGPDWFALTADGVLSAQPKDDQAGDYTVRVIARNDVKPAYATLAIKVRFKNTPPRWLQQSISLPTARARTIYNQGFANHADDIDKFQNLRFSKVSGPSWAIVDPAGSIFGTPESTDTGRVSMQVRVDDGAGGTAVATVNFNVEAANTAPTAPNGGSLQLPAAFQGELFLFNLPPFFRDAQGDKLTFRKIFGPNWMRVKATGEVTGVPGPDSFGQYQVIFEVNDGNAATQVKATGLVKQQ